MVVKRKKKEKKEWQDCDEGGGRADVMVVRESVE